MDIVFGCGFSVMIASVAGVIAGKVCISVLLLLKQLLFGKNCDDHYIDFWITFLAWFIFGISGFILSIYCIPNKEILNCALGLFGGSIGLVSSFFLCIPFIGLAEDV